MSTVASSLLFTLASLPLAWAQACTLQFDGRIAADFALADFDATNDFFDSDSVFGQGMCPVGRTPS